MRIAAVDLFLYDAPFVFGYHSGHLLRLRADSLIIALRCEGGVTGYGESSPRSYVTGESPASVKILFESILIHQLIGQELETVADVEQLLENLKQTCRKRGVAEFQSALGSVDIALLDALGKHQFVPVCNFLGPELRKKLPWSIVIPLFSDAIIRKFSEESVRRAFSSVKVLVNRDESQNYDRLKLVRELFGDEIEMRIEVNGHWTREEARSNLKKLTGFGITAIEQPVAKGDLDGLRQIRETFGIPVIVDESMCGPEDAEELIAGDACDILNIKISKVGGLLSARRIASLAASRGISCLLGCHVGETKILTSAAIHFLVTAPNLLLVEGFSSVLFGDVSAIDDLDPERMIREIATNRGLGFDPRETILRERAPEETTIPLPIETVLS